MDNAENILFKNWIQEADFKINAKFDEWRPVTGEYEFFFVHPETEEEIYSFMIQVFIERDEHGEFSQYEREILSGCRWGNDGDVFVLDKMSEKVLSEALDSNTINYKNC